MFVYSILALLAVGILDVDALTRVGWHHGDLEFLGNVVDTWWKWVLLVLTAFFNTAVHEYAISTVYSWMMNSMRNPHSGDLGVSEAHAALIVQSWVLYTVVDGIVTVGIVLSQVDIWFAAFIAKSIISRWMVHREVRQHRYQEVS